MHDKDKSKHLFSSHSSSSGVVGGKQKASSLLLERTTVSSSDVTAKVAWTMAGDRAFSKVPFPAKVTKHVTMLEYCSDDVPKE